MLGRGILRASAVLVAVALASASLVACGSSEDESDAATQQAANAATRGGAACEEPQKLQFNLAFTYGYSSALMALAKEKGWYAAECLDVELLQGSGSTDTVKLLGSGAAKIGQADAISVAAGQAQGMPITAVGVETQTNPFTLIAREDVLDAAQVDARPFDLGSLAGKTYGAVEGGAPALIWTYLLKRDDIDPSEFKRVGIAPPGLAEIVNGQVDFITNYAPQVAALEQSGARVQAIGAEDLDLTAYGTSYVVNDGFARDNPEQVRGFLAATGRAMEYLPDHAEEAVDALCKIAAAQCTGDRNRELILEQVQQYAALFAGPDGRHQCMSEPAWQQTEEIVAATNDGARAAERPFTNEYLSGC